MISPSHFFFFSCHFLCLSPRLNTLQSYSKSYSWKINDRHITWLDQWAGLCCVSRCSGPLQLHHMGGGCNDIRGACRTHTDDVVIWLGAQYTNLEACCDCENSHTEASPCHKAWSHHKTYPEFTVVSHPGVPASQCSHLGVHVEVCGKGGGQWGDWCCHIDGLVCSLLVPAIRSAAQETATCLLRNADARLTYQLYVTALLPHSPSCRE